LRLDFEVQFKPGGFTNRAADAAVVANGTKFTNVAWLPAIGYEKDRELSGSGERKQHGLAARAPLPPPDDERARHDQERNARVEFEAIVGTDQGQIAVAPGRLKNSWTDKGRRYFHYATDVPIRNDYAFYSANYSVRQAQWRPPDGSGPEVSLEVFYHPEHALNVDRMLRSVQASLDYYTRMLGPYPHRQVRFVEHPGNSVVLHAAPVNVSYDERFSLLNPDKDPRGLDLPFAVVAHEMAHQWWGNTVTAARAEGAALLSETLAWYSAMGVVEQALGRDHLPRLLRMMREVYLIPDTRANVPLLRAADPFLGYRKGPFAMYALREYVGREPIDAALRRYFEQHAAGALPLPTSLDLYRELQAVTPESLRPLLADLFERNTFWELATERATAKQLEGGAWQVVLNVGARKVVVGQEGGEKDLSMDDPVEVGVFAGAEDGALGEVLYLQRHRVQTGENRIVVTVPRQPARAGIDPRRLLIDVGGDDNVREISR
jgi:ABC-2 type transport system permease protein